MLKRNSRPPRSPFPDVHRPALRPAVLRPHPLRLDRRRHRLHGDPDRRRRACRPRVLLVPLQHTFGWSADTISGAVSLNILLLGLTGPFVTALMQTIGIRRTMLSALVLLLAGAGGSAFVTQPWQLYLTWGLLVGLGAGATGFGVAATIANRWFVARRGLVIGLLTASNASGQLVFLPALAALATHLRLGQRADRRVAAGARAGPLRLAAAGGNPRRGRHRSYGASRGTAHPADRGQPVPRRLRGPGARRPLGRFLAAGRAASRCAASPPTG